VSRELEAPAASSFKHVSPAGAAVAGDLDEVMERTWRVTGSDLSPLARAYVRARDADPKSSFGDFIAVSEPVDSSLAQVIRDVVSDGIIAPGFEPGVLDLLAAKKNGTFLVIEVDPFAEVPQWEERDVYGVRLSQETDVAPLSMDVLRACAPTVIPEQALRDLLLGMIVLRFTQSNSVAYVRDGMAIGIGAGQQSRVDCTKLAGAKVDTWWLRRSPAIRGLAFRPGVGRQDRINWQIRAIEGDLTTDERTRLQTVLAGELPSLAEQEEWLRRLNGFAFVSDGFIPFRDNIDYAAKHGVQFVAEPGGSNREAEVKQACLEHSITHISTGIRLFHH
jgi:phosphoribosylaminoimidazolecarboxamide formyltransferase/IMP cyclohydrolase